MRAVISALAVVLLRLRPSRRVGFGEAAWRRFAPACGLLLLAVVPLVPTAAADYGCTSLPLSALCTGVDRAPDCFGENAYYDWGFDVFGPYGYTVMVGGKKWCMQGEEGTVEGKSMDAGVYTPGGQRVAARSDEVARTPPGEDTQTTCVTTVEARLSLVQQGRSFACLFEPAHPGELLP